MLDKWSDIKVGTKITGFSTMNTNYFDNLFVTAKGADWAVLRNGANSLVSCLLEPSDRYEIGEHLPNLDGSLSLHTTV